MSLALVIGGTRSGKSAHAERLAIATGLPVRYVATADGSDAAMADRIATHAARRPPSWITIEAGDDLVTHERGDAVCLLVDGLGTWIAGVLHRAGAFTEPPSDASIAQAQTTVRAAVRRLCDTRAPTAVVVVAEDAGHGVLPSGVASRAWLDLLGESTQTLSAAATRVELVIAGRCVLLSAPEPSEAGLRHHGDRDVRPGDADHAVNVLAGGPPPWLRPVIDRALQETHRYPDESAAVAAVAALHGREPDEIVPTNGAAEALWLLPAALRPQLAACVHPAFTEAEAALHAHAIPAVRVLRDPDSNFALDPTRVPDEADLVIVGNPASPSGTLDPASALVALRRPGRVLVVDEAFMSLIPGEPGSLAAQRLDDVIVVRSLTKALAVPGLRVGYAIAARALAERLRAVRPPWSANSVALAVLTAAAGRPDALARAAERATAERTDLERHLAGVTGLRVWPAAANFCLVEVADGPSTLTALRDEGIAVRPADSFPGLGPDHLRITARDPESNARLAAVLARAVA